MAQPAFTANPAATTIPGGGLDESLTGTDGDDVFPGGPGRQFMAGGTGDDLYFVDSQDDVVTEAADGGQDSIDAAVSFTLPDNVEALGLDDSAGDASGTGNGLDNEIFGNTGNNVLIGLDGNDLLDGGDGDDVLLGGAGDDSLFGWVGENTLAGDAGNDQYWVTYNTTITFELADGGEDLVHVSPASGAENAYYLQPNIEGLLIEGDNDSWGVGNAGDNFIDGNGGANVLLGGAGDDSLSGGAGDDTLYGEAGSDTLDAGSGTDVLSGGADNDVYVVNSMAQLIYEAADGGAEDLVQATVGAGLANAYWLYANIESLQLMGEDDSWGLGNELANSITGNVGANTLFGNDGADTLTGGAGGDTLYGGAGDDLLDAGEGTDTLAGGDGNDTYVVDGREDLIFEAAEEGQDLVIATVGAGADNAYYLYANLESLQLDGIADSWGAGNDLANSIMGNAGANWLFGAGGADTLSGGAGNDVLYGGEGADLFVIAAGTGAETIADFAVGEDRILLSGTGFADFAAVQAAMVEVDGLSALDLGGGDFLVVVGVAKADFTAADFAFV